MKTYSVERWSSCYASSYRMEWRGSQVVLRDFEFFEPGWELVQAGLSRHDADLIAHGMRLDGATVRVV